MDTDDFIEIRRYLHQHPELSGEEGKTSAYIQQQLSKLAPHFSCYPVGKTGILAQLKSEQPGKHILLRCELDALPIQETNTFDHQSTTSGVSHKCGHDGHMTILLAVAHHFDTNPPENGTISLIFQPAEENGKGAPEVLADPYFQRHCQPDFIFALHNVPGFERHTIVHKAKAFTPAVISVEISFNGKTAHAAEPENGDNPAMTIAQLLNEIDNYQVTDPDSDDFKLFTIVYANLGSQSYGISAGTGVLGLTLRTWEEKTMEEMQKWLTDITDRMAKKGNLTVEYNWFEKFSAVHNHPEAHAILTRAMENSNLNTIEKSKPFKWGEDYGLYTQKYNGLMFGLGSGVEMPALHNPDYDFPDDIIQTGKNAFVAITKEALK